MSVSLVCGDCLDVMPQLPAASVDLVCADLPYGTTACKWDTVIPFAPLWEQYRRLIKPRGAIVLTASQPFTSALVMSNPGWFRYEWIWRKSRVTGFLDAKRRPLKRHESALLFSPVGYPTYQPQMRRGEPHLRGGWGKRRRGCETYQPFADDAALVTDEYYPDSVLDFDSVTVPIHNNEKPVALMEYLIRTYSNEGDTVLDNAVGSGTTIVACLNTGRNGIGIEKDREIFATAETRIRNAERSRAELLIA